MVVTWVTSSIVAYKKKRYGARQPYWRIFLEDTTISAKGIRLLPHPHTVYLNVMVFFGGVDVKYDLKTLCRIVKSSRRFYDALQIHEYLQELKSSRKYIEEYPYCDYYMHGGQRNLLALYASGEGLAYRKYDCKPLHLKTSCLYDDLLSQ